MGAGAVVNVEAAWPHAATVSAGVHAASVNVVVCVPLGGCWPCFLSLCLISASLSWMVYTPVPNEQKFSSNVVEKCLQMASEDLRDVLIRELCSDDAIGRMLQDQYGTS